MQEKLEKGITQIEGEQKRKYTEVFKSGGHILGQSASKQ